ncbi:MAG: DUF1501 domain-containing protein [Gemmataceae bacterium]|nr:DUF1501 domain-containing protein [Gemmataceae bacterium]
MLTLLGNKQKFCDGITRRNFMKIGALGAGLTLTDMLRLRAMGGQTGTTQKSAIMIYLPGGPSHMDMYDLKPQAPVEFRGEFNPIQTNVAGVQICEHMPMQAKMWDKLSVVRSCISVDEHSDSLVTTGYSENINRTQNHPSVGSVISKLRGASGDIPPYVSLRGMSIGQEPGFLGIAHRAFSPSGPGVENLRLGNGITMNRLDDRKQLLGNFDTVRRDIDASGTMKGLDSFASRAFEMVASGAVRKALDLSKEDPRIRDRYKGVEQFLTARRLVEAGVGCVTLNIGGWDTHEKNFKQLKTQLPQVDKGIANLIQDLHDRGMENDVVTIMCGEFGRTPRINNSDGGRDHWGPVMSVLLAGGGLKMGQAIGTTNARAEYPKDRPYRMSQVLSSVYHALGIDPSMTFNNQTGRPMYILEDREPVSELI